MRLLNRKFPGQWLPTQSCIWTKKQTQTKVLLCPKHGYCACGLIVCVEHFLRKTGILARRRNDVGWGVGVTWLNLSSHAQRVDTVKAGEWPHLCPENQSPGIRPQNCAHVLNRTVGLALTQPLLARFLGAHVMAGPVGGQCRFAWRCSP